MVKQCKERITVDMQGGISKPIQGRIMDRIPKSQHTTPPEQRTNIQVHFQNSVRNCMNMVCRVTYWIPELPPSKLLLNF